MKTTVEIKIDCENRTYEVSTTLVPVEILLDVLEDLTYCIKRGDYLKDPEINITGV